MRKFIKAFFILSSTLSVLILIAVSVLGANMPNEFFVCGDGVSKMELSDCVELAVIGDAAVPAGAISAKESDVKGEISLLGIFPVKTVDIHLEERKNVTVSGEPFGIKIYADGVLVISLDGVETESGKKNPAADAGLREGDFVRAINGTRVYKTEDVANAVEKANGETLEFEVVRDGRVFTARIEPQLFRNQNVYKVGMWVRDSCAGIGTMTMIDVETKVFAGLGHAVCDADTGKIMTIKSGEIVPAKVTGIYKSVSGTAGEICGILSMEERIAGIEVNDETGVYGIIGGDVTGEEMPVAYKQEIKTGKAQILTTVEGDKPKLYNIEIVRINLGDTSKQKNMIIRITDGELLEKTGGIVQGMSGSPIIQNGMLVGAVTHVFINNPNEGYAIFAENMLETAGLLRNRENKIAS